jgi:thymidine kinase
VNKRADYEGTVTHPRCRAVCSVCRRNAGAQVRVNPRTNVPDGVYIDAHGPYNHRCPGVYTSGHRIVAGSVRAPV